MQPPPRKGNYAKFLKNLHTEQVAKLQLKNQNECELLEDIRNFILKRSAIEKSYAEALLKISSAFLNRKIANIPDIKTEGSDERWNMWNVWRTVLEENEKLARARLAAVEIFSQHVADDAKILRANKLLTAKKCLDQLALIQKEVQSSVSEVDKTKKFYFDEEHSAHDVRDKARDIEEKLKKKKGSFFQSITSLQKNSAKVSSRRDALEEKSTGARNDFLLSLAAANAHQTRYFVVDFQNTIQTMEQGVYDRVSDYFMLISRTELLTCTATQTSFNRIKEQSAQLSRDYNLQCIYLSYPVLKQHIQYDFEACDNDNVTTVSLEHSSLAGLGKEAKRWATRISREMANIRETQSKLATLQSLRDSGQKTDPSDPNGPDVETKMDELRQALRRSETAKVKAEARLLCLKEGGVNVDEFIQEAESLSVQDLPRSSSSMSVRTDVSGTAEQGGSDSMYDSDYNDATSEAAVERPASVGEKERPDSTEVDGEWAMLEQERQRIEQLTAGWDDPTQIDWGPEDSTEQQPPDNRQSDETGPTYKCTALYNYTAQNPDELSIVENEQLEVVGEGDGDGWLRARNYRGEEGYVPHNYLDVERDEPEMEGGLGNTLNQDSSYQLTSQISFSSVDYTVDDEPSEVSAGQETVKEVIKPANLDLSTSSDFTTRTEPTGESWCVAIYDYEATCPEELSFYEGEVIQVLRKVVHDGVDDGWWEGRRGDDIGLFPSLVVEECRQDGEPLTPEGEDTPPESAPPVFTPPDIPSFMLAPQSVIITQATPLVETNPLTEMKDSEKGSFTMAMTKGQQKQYEQQFDGDVEISVCVTGDDEPQQINGDETGKCPTDNSETVVKPAHPTEFNSGGGGGGGLGAHIVITAATPMVEEDKPFPPPPPSQPSSGSQELDGDDATTTSSADEPSPANNEEPPKYSSLTRGGDGAADLSASSDEENDATTSYTGPSTAENSVSASAASASVSVGGGGAAKVVPPSQPTTTATTTAMTATTVDSEKKPETIPDELEPHQLARLQDLKESDA